MASALASPPEETLAVPIQPALSFARQWSKCMHFLRIVDAIVVSLLASLWIILKTKAGRDVNAQKSKETHQGDVLSVKKVEGPTEMDQAKSRAFAQALVRISHAGGPGPTKMVQTLCSQSRHCSAEFSATIAPLLDKCPAHITDLDTLHDRVESARDAAAILLIQPDNIGSGSCAQVNLALTSVVTVQMDDGDMVEMPTPIVNYSKTTAKMETKWIALKYVAPNLVDSLDMSFAFLQTLCQGAISVGWIRQDRDKLMYFIDSVKQSVLQEADMQRQLANQLLAFTQFSMRSYNLRIPRPYPHLSNENVLAMEYLNFVSLETAAELYANNHAQREALAQTAVSYFKDFCFIDMRLDPEMHKGNVKVQLADCVTDTPAMLVKLDFGICFEITEFEAKDFAQFSAALLLMRLDNVSAWFVKHLCYDKSREPVMETDVIRNHLAEQVSEVVDATIGKGAKEPNWANCAGKITAVFSANAVHLDNKANNYFLGLVQLQGVLDVLLPEHNTIKWLQGNAQTKRFVELLKDIIAG